MTAGSRWPLRCATGPSTGPSTSVPWEEFAKSLGGGDDFGGMTAELVGLRLLEGVTIDNQLADDVIPIVFAQGWRSGGQPIDAL